MRKIYCDICGQEINQSYEGGLEVCPACALELYHIIENLREEKRKKKEGKSE